MSLPRRLPALLAAAIAALLALPALAAAAQPGITPVGYTDGRQVDEGSSIAQALGNAPADGKWVRIFADWDQTVISPAAVLGGLDARINRFLADGEQVIVTVQTPPPGIDMNTAAGQQAYADFMGHTMVPHFKGRVAVWELWNEPDGTFWTGGRPASPAAYAGLLERTYPEVKAADPSALAITGGLVGNDWQFVQGLYDDGAGRDFDGVAVHTDTSCRVDPPGLVGDYVDGRISRWAFTGYREVHSVMADHGDAAKGIWMTEIGWSDSAGRPCADGRAKPDGVTEAQQAAYLKQAFACVAADSYVKVASWFTLQDSSSSLPYGLFRADGTKRAAFAALQSVGDGTGAGVDRSCGGVVDHTPPAVSLSVAPSYTDRLQVDGHATDAGTGVARIDLYVDGKRVWGKKVSSLNLSWARSGDLSYGTHRVQLKSTDVAGNVGVATATVVRGNPKTGPRTIDAAVRFHVKRKGHRLRFSASVAPPADGSYAEKPSGFLQLRIAHRVHGHWQKAHRNRGIRTGSVRYVYHAGHGTYRVYAVLLADAPYKRLTTRKQTFDIPR